MLKYKRRKHSFRLIRLLNGIFLVILSLFVGFYPASLTIAADNSDFTIATTTENVTTGNNNQTLSITESVANVSVGEDTQTITIGTTAANVSEEKASTTITVEELPAAEIVGYDPDTGYPIYSEGSIVIGSCVVTFRSTLGVTSDQTDCGSNSAIIDTDKNIGNIDRTAPEIATVLSQLTNVNDPIHGALTPSLDGNSVTFTTAGTETSATNITFTDYTDGKIALTEATAGSLPEYQVNTVTPANIESGDTFTVIINGTTVSYTSTSNLIADVTGGLTSAINASSQSTNVIAEDQITKVQITSKTAGTPFTIAGGTTNRTTTVAQVDAITPANIEVGDTFTVIINGSTISYTATSSTLSAVTAGITAAINASLQSSNVTATDHSVRLDVTANTPGDPFTITGGTINRPPVAQVSTVTPLTIKAEETVYVKINDNSYYYTIKVGDTASNVIAGLEAAITSSDVTVSGTDEIILTAKVAGSAFTVSAGFSEVTLTSSYGVTRDTIKIGDISGNLRIGDITASSAKIIWNTETLADGTLYVSKSKSKLRRTNLPSSLLRFTDTNSSLVHGFIVEGLRKKAKHYFIIVANGNRSKIYNFKTQGSKKVLY